MKRPLLLSLLALSLLCPAASSAAERTYELAFTSEGYRENHVVYQQVWEPWMQEVEKRSNGRLKIVFYSPGSICTSKEVPDAVVKGRVDIGHSLFGANPGLYGYSDTGEANVPGNSSMAASMGFYNYVTKNDWVKAELDNKEMKLLTIWSTGPMMLTSRTPITKVDDLKGRKINYHISGADELITTFGAVPIFVAPPDIYMSIQRGQTDTSLMALTILKPFKLYEVLTEILNYPIAPGYHYMVMNRSVWESLPADLQKILEETTGEAMSRAIATAVDASIKDSVDYVLSNGKCRMNEMSAEEQAKMAKFLEPFQQNWIASMEKRGFSRAKEALTLFEKCMEEASAQYGGK